MLALGHDGAFALNDWSFTQLCGVAGVSKDTVNRLSAETAAEVFRETMPGGNKPIQLFTTDQEVRSIHGHSYTRLFNADLRGDAHGVRRRLPAPAEGFQRRRRASTLGEQDMFMFLIDPAGWTEIGGEAFPPASSSGSSSHDASVFTFIESLGVSPLAGIVGASSPFAPALTLRAVLLCGCRGRIGSCTWPFPSPVISQHKEQSVADSNPCLRKNPTASGDSQFSSAHSAPEDAGDGCIEESCIRKAVTESRPDRRPCRPFRYNLDPPGARSTSGGW